LEVGRFENAEFPITAPEPSRAVAGLLR
jgi:hypothetical protein